MLLLTLDDNKGSLTFGDILRLTTITVDELDYCLQACIKQKLLKR